MRSASCAAPKPGYTSDKHCCLLPGNVRGRKRCCTRWQEGKERKTGTRREHTKRDTNAERKIKGRVRWMEEERSKTRKRWGDRRGSSNIIKHVCMKH